MPVNDLLPAAAVMAAPQPNALGPQPATDPYDYTARYNTQLAPAEEAQYQAWLQAQSMKAGRDMSGDAYDYDMRGAWKSGAAASENNHYPDTFKKPNHPTFSDQSQYHGVDGAQGGTWGGGNGSPWTFTPGATTLQMMSPSALQRYFQEREPGNTLILPGAQR